MKSKQKTNPPGRIKIMKSFTQLMEKKDFHSITTAEIAGKAGVTEGLIYKYFKDKKDLLYQVLGEEFKVFLSRIRSRVAREPSCEDQLKVFITTSLEVYTQNRVFSRILMLEVRNSPVYFESMAYEMVKEYAATILDILQRGIENKEFKPDTDPYLLRKIILGAIEHACLKEVIFNGDIDNQKVALGISQIILNGVRK